MQSVVIVSCLLVAVAHAGLVAPHYPVPAPRHEVVYDYVAYPQYKFDYSVADSHTGDAKTQWEHRDGDRVTGAYSLIDADGTTRIVEYSADDHNGFQAVVKRLGHPAPRPAVHHAAPVHAAPALHAAPAPHVAPALHAVPTLHAPALPYHG